MDSDSHHQFAGYRNFATRLAARSVVRGDASSVDFEQQSVAASSVCNDRTVELSEDDIQELTRLADSLLHNLRASYETHAFHNHLKVDKKLWKTMKKREQFAVYKQKLKQKSVEASNAAVDATGVDAASSSVEGTEEVSMPLLMLTGSVAGQMQDALYGLASATTSAMKFKSSYCQDSVLDAEVLATIQGPSIDEPFRFLGIKWVLQSHSNSTKKRDLLYLESTGMTTLTNGEAVGYHIVHSVNLNSRRTQFLGARSSSSPVVRAKTSVGHLFRQRSNGTSIDVFMRGYYDPSGGMLHFLAVNLAADQLLHTAASILECASLKKLSWSAHQSGRKRRATTILRATQRETYSVLQEMAAAAEEVDAERYGGGSAASVCTICSRKYGRVLQRGGASCTICAQVVCSRCSVVKKLSFSRNDGALSAAQVAALDLERSGVSNGSAQSSLSTSSKSSKLLKEICQKSLNFCIPCIVKCNNESAAHVAVEEMLDQQAAAVVSNSHLSSSTATPRQVLMAASMRRRTTRAGSAAHYMSTTPRFTYNAAMSTSNPVSTTTSKTPRPKAFSTTSTASSTTSSVILYEEPPAAAS